MPSGYFSTQRDNEVIIASGFFCEACLVGKPVGEQSPDSRYCKGCYEFLVKEAEMIKAGGQRIGDWKPVTPSKDTVSSGCVPLPVKERAVAKLGDKEILPSVVMQQEKHHGGRPRKEGQVNRSTAWRRVKQGVLL
jgi:hypothetical protein